jgi:hypothetical protein
MFIGTVDLVATAVLHAQGKIVELNPIMKVFIERSEWLFAGVKAMTLVVAFVVMRNYAEHNPQFVHRACLAGSAAYVFIWTCWFFGAS